MRHETVYRLIKGAAAIVSGVLLWWAFPPLARGDVALLALAPLLMVIRRCAPRAAFGWAFLSGLVFWMSTLSWFPAIIKNDGPWPLVLLGEVALSAWCALFWGVFAAASAVVWRWAGAAPGVRRVAAAAVAVPLLWAGTEYVRGWLFSGFAWNFLGVSQVGNLPLVQSASVAGVYGVSALVVLVNGAAATLFDRMLAPLEARLSSAAAAPGLSARLWCSAESFLPLVLFFACWLWGLARVAEWNRRSPGESKWQIALVQPNSPCIFEVNSETIRRQVGLLVDQTRLAGAARPDLTVWPETAVLGSVPFEPNTMRVIRDGAAAAGGPLLTGALEVERVERGRAAPEGLNYYNAAWLFSASGEAMGRYRKRHLVPFGEYIPLDKAIPVLQRLAPTGVSCTAGRGPGVLRVVRKPGEELALGPLICFEDTVPPLSRDAVRAGATLLVLMTNDAWFNGSIEPVQHMNQSVFRAVENGVPMARAANSGVSCTVDPVGRVSRLESKGASMDFSGFMASQIAVPSRPLGAPYTRWGDWPLAIPGAALACALAAWGLFGRRPRRT